MKSRLFKAIILGLAIGLVGLLLSPFRFALNLEENTGLGLLFKLRGVQQPSDEVVIVSICHDHLARIHSYELLAQVYEIDS